MTVSSVIESLCEKEGLNSKFCIVVAIVESELLPYLPNGFPTLYFNKYIFLSYLRRHESKAISKAINIDSTGYEAYIQACRLNTHKAMLATSFGLYRIIGFNYDEAGYSTVEDMVMCFKDSVSAQVQAFIEFAKANKLVEAINALDFRTFAKVYNGPMYYKREYDKHLAEVYYA